MTHSMLGKIVQTGRTEEKISHKRITIIVAAVTSVISLGIMTAAVSGEMAGIVIVLIGSVGHMMRGTGQELGVYMMGPLME